MKFVSMTIASDTRESMIGDALRSVVDWVDLCLIVHLVDSECTPDRTMEIAKEIAGDKLRVVDVSIYEPFAEMRNAGLRGASALGADWGIILDTDERILLNTLDIRGSLPKIPAEVSALSVYDTTGQYDKIRFIRLPGGGTYSMDTHEDFIPSAKISLAPRIRFWELEKSQETIRKNFEIQLQGLKVQHAQDPDNPRWMYYIGWTMESMGDLQEASEWFLRSLQHVQDLGTTAWTYFCLARVESNQEKAQECLNYAIEGMRHRPDYAELPWIAGFACLRLGRLEDAINWSKIAVLFSWRGVKDPHRICFKDPRGLFEGPYEVMESAYRAMGDRRSDWAKKEVMRAVKDRTAFFQRGQA